MVARPGCVEDFDAVDEISVLAVLKEALSVSQAEELLPQVKTILASAEDIGVQTIEVHGAALVIRVAEGVRESARLKVSQLGFPQCRVE